MFRLFLKYNRLLLGALCLCAVNAVVKYLRAITEEELMPGIIAVIQSFGARINFHPHLYVLMTEGGMDHEGRFRKIFRFDDTLIDRLIFNVICLFQDVKR